MTDLILSPQYLPYDRDNRSCKFPLTPTEYQDLSFGINKWCPSNNFYLFICPENIKYREKISF